MPNHVQEPGPYTLANLLSEARRQLPALVRSVHVPFLGGPPTAPISFRVRVALWLRLARLLGCPVCVALFPMIARRRGWNETEITAALEGRTADLPAELAAAVAWAEAVQLEHGERPAVAPDGAAALPEELRAAVLAFVRLERVIHATGLMFLPQAWIRRAAGM